MFDDGGPDITVRAIVVTMIVALSHCGDHDQPASQSAAVTDSLPFFLTTITALENL